MDLSPGRAFGPYTILRPLGRGSMGQVLLARDADGQKRAVKLRTSDRPKAHLRFAREIEVGSRLDHPNVVRVVDSGQVRGVDYLAMEYVRGKDLQAILDDVSRLHPRVVLRLTRQLGHGLQAFHEAGFVHRDLKPANILMTPKGALKIADFGLVHDPAATKVTKTGVLVGTPWYIAPEQVRGQGTGPAADLFAMALVVYRCLTGGHPFLLPDEKNPIQYLLRLPKASPRAWHPRAMGGPLDRAFRRAFDQDPAKRYRGPLSFARAVDQAFRAEKGRGRSVAATQRLPAVSAE